MKCAVLAITAGASRFGKNLSAQIEADFYPCKGIFKKTFEKVWQKYDGIICIMATGIVVRTLAPLLSDKSTDPAVVVCDEKGSFAISLLSGHLGGANELAQKVAALTGGQPVITTASDVLGKTTLDTWCRDNNLTYSDKILFTKAMGKLVDTGSLRVFSDYPLDKVPDDFTIVDTFEQADCMITCRKTAIEDKLHLYPKSIAIGIGCRRGTSSDAIEEAISSACKENNIASQSIAKLASITLKKDEQGLLDYAAQNNLTITFYTPEELNSVQGIAPSSATVQKVTGAKAVAEPAALLAAGADKLAVNKIKFPQVTISIAEITNPLTMI
jgi:cobalt-precorrin 5A hydrolase